MDIIIIMTRVLRLQVIEMRENVMVIANTCF